MDPFKYREIVGTFTARLPDGGDTDQLPDRVLLNGYGTLRPNIRGTSVVFTEAGEFAVPRTRQVAFVDGELMVEVVDGESSILQPLFLEVTVDERANQEWSWTLTFDSLTIGEWGEEISHPALSFPVEEGDGPLELSTVATTVTRTANFVSRGAPGAGLQEITAANGEIVFSWDNGKSTSIDVPDAVPGPPGEGIPQTITATGATISLSGGGGSVTIPTATTSEPGLLAAEDKLRIDSAPTSASVQAAINAAKVTVNVKDYGAVGDGTTDDTLAFQLAVSAVEDAGGGSLIIPPAEYQISGHVQLCSNIDVSGYGATLAKRHDISTTSYAYFSTLSGKSKGYGSGGRNIRVAGIRFTGDFENNKTTCGFALHHAQNVVIEQCEFHECQGNGHCIDLAGCEAVTIRSCRFVGFKEAAAGSGYRRTECIQIDASVAGAPSVLDDPESFDGLFTRSVTVERCEFLPLAVGGTTYPAPNPLGTHLVIEGARAESITFRDNTVGTLTTDTTSTWRGGIHFPGVRGLTIEGNDFINVGSNSRVIALHGASVGRPAGSDMSLPLPNGNVPITPVGVDDVTIRNNSFLQANVATTGVQEIVVVDAGDSLAKNVTVDSNSFTVDALTGIVVRVDGGKRVSVTNNLGEGVHTALDVRQSEGLRVGGNTWECSPPTPQTQLGATTQNYRTVRSLTVEGEWVRNPLHQAVWVGDGSVDVSINGVVVVDPSQPASNQRQVISIAGASRFTVSACKIYSSAEGDRAINAYGASENGLIADNMAVGYVTLATNADIVSVELRGNREL